MYTQVRLIWIKYTFSGMTHYWSFLATTTNLLLLSEPSQMDTVLLVFASTLSKTSFYINDSTRSLWMHKYTSKVKQSRQPHNCLYLSLILLLLVGLISKTMIIQSWLVLVLVSCSSHWISQMHFCVIFSLMHACKRSFLHFFKMWKVTSCILDD